MKLKIDEIEIDEDIYPRINKWKKETVDSYADALKAGAKFPPLEVQKVNKENEIIIIVLDGVHRIKAHEKYNEDIEQQKKKKDKKLDEGYIYEPMETIDVEYWKDEVLDYEEYKLALILRSAFLNMKHGDRLTIDDKRRLAVVVTGSYLKNCEKKGEDENE